MTCDQALDRMLDADPAVLRGATDPERPELARHLETCGRCRRVASALAAELDRLDEALAAGGSSAAAETAAERALRAARDGGGRTRRWRWRMWAPLAAAAVVALVLLPARDDAPLPDAGAPPSGAPVAPRVAVAAPPDRGVAVLETEDPTITIIWLYDLEGS